MKKLHMYLCALMLLLVVPSAAQAVLLTDLINGQSITAGDKLFDQWAPIFQNTSDGHTVDTDNIEVTALNDGGLDPGPGLRFDVLNNELAVTGDNAHIDFPFGFHVSVLDPKYKIKDASLGSMNAFIGYTVDGVSDGVSDDGGYLVESLGTGAGRNDLGIVSNEFSLLDDVLTSKLSDSVAFAPQSEIWVTKSIRVRAIDATHQAGLQGFTERFSQIAAVPEPSIWLLVTVGLVGIGLVRRNMRAQ
jgi:hypothetical protein